MHIRPSFLLLLPLCLSVFFPCAAQSKVNLADLDLSKVEQAYGAPSKNKSVTGEELRIAGRVYKNGVGFQAPCRLKFVLMGDCSEFSCKAGVNDNNISYSDRSLIQVPLVDGTKILYSSPEEGKHFLGIASSEGTVSKGSVDIRFVGDGKELYSTSVIRQGEDPKEIVIKTSGVKVFEIIISDGGDGISSDHVDLLDAQFDYFEIPPTLVTPDFISPADELDKELAKALSDKISSLPQISLPSVKPSKDWLIDDKDFVSSIGKSKDGKTIIMSNGLVSRSFRVLPNLSTIDIRNLMTGESILRTVATEGSVTIDGATYPLGGLAGQIEYGYLRDNWIDELTAIPGAFQVIDFTISDIQKRMDWKHKRWSLVKDWDTSGKELTFKLTGPGLAKGVIILLHYTIYDGIPIIGKWLELFNESGVPVMLNDFTLEDLPTVEYEANVDGWSGSADQNIYVCSDWGGTKYTTTDWQTDARYTSQVSYRLLTKCKLVVKLPLGPEELVPDNGSFSSFHNWIMPYDGSERERRGLFEKHFLNRIAPWTTENPIFMHCTSVKSEDVKTAIDQCAETGYEMVILSFGSGFDMEDDSEDNIRKYKEFADYAHSKGIEIGGYSLLASRWISDEVDIINPETGKRGGMTFGSSPCLCSDWGQDYFRKMKEFYEKTGMDVLEHDGSYSGDPCASTDHAHHSGLEDSQWKQNSVIKTMYRWMCANGIYMNVPDDGYRLVGTNKSSVGYREVNWSLPRDRQIVLGRQNIYDGLWRRTPTNSWTFVPLVQYHGGGAAATLEPLDEHLDYYKAHMMQNYGSGVQACYRGFRLYDTQRTKETVKEVIDWYKQYRDILNSDFIHIRRPDGRDWDGFLHVNPSLEDKGFLMVFNPTDEPITRTITVPLYYTGLRGSASVSEQDSKPIKHKMDHQNNIEIQVRIEANGYNWYLIR